MFWGREFPGFFWCVFFFLLFCLVLSLWLVWGRGGVVGLILGFGGGVCGFGFFSVVVWCGGGNFGETVS